MPDDFKVQIAEVDPCRRAATATSFGLSFSDVAKDLKTHSYKWMKAVNNAPTTPIFGNRIDKILIYSKTLSTTTMSSHTHTHGLERIA